jgi:hypothetical protein
MATQVGIGHIGVALICMDWRFARAAGIGPSP